MFYKESIEWINGIGRSGSNYGVERERRLLDLLGSPDKNLKIVHIAGTNGKGSVSAFLTAICVSACLKTGTFNSPAVFDYNESFLLNGTPIAGGFLAEGYTLIRETIEKEQARCSEIGEEFLPTQYEIETAFALWCFNKQNCDIVILETGIGGRLDATNAICDKQVAVITTIGLDHCAMLGNTLFDIATEKAQIIKKDAISYRQSDEVIDAINNKVKSVNGTLTLASTATLLACDIEGQVFEYKGEHYSIPLLGSHQLINASIAIECAKALQDKGFKISDEDIKYGLASAEWHARFEVIFAENNRFNLIIPHDKVLVLDGGHNPQGAQILVDCIKNYFAGMRIHLVVGILKDKDYKEMVNILAPIANKVSTVTPPSPRALSAIALADAFKDVGVDATPYDLVPLGVQQALGDNYGDVVVICGSLTLFQSLGRKI